jgi:signal transduction histidine kinase
MAEEVEKLLEELADWLFVSKDSPISTALALLEDGAVMTVRAPGGSITGEKKNGDIHIIEPESDQSLFEIVFEYAEDLKAFNDIVAPEEFGEIFLSLANEGKLRLDMILPFMKLWTMGVGFFLKEIGVLSAPSSYTELISPLQLRDIAFSEILDTAYLQGLVDELARITGMRLWILDMNSMPVVVSVTGGEHCKLIIDSLEGVMRCFDSAIGGLAELQQAMKPKVRVCHAGFICLDAPLILGGEMVGMISGDASLTESPDPEVYRELALELGIDPEPLLVSMEQVRNVDIAEVEFLLSVVNAIAQVVTEMSFKQYLLSSQMNENTMLTQELWRKNVELKALFQSIVEIEEREKAAVARDLHDDTGQNLSNALVNLELALSEEGLAEGVRGHVESASLSISQVLKQLHDLSASLHPPILDDLGLVEALRNLVRRVNTDHPIDFAFIASGEEGELPGEVKINLYRIAQEALANIMKHSEAREALIFFNRYNGGLDLVICDDGRGFEESERAGGSAEADGRVHLGLLNMRERAEQIGGAFDCPDCGQGVTIAVHLPLS